jgi:hypothetical protein
MDKYGGAFMDHGFEFGAHGENIARSDSSVREFWL